MSMHNVKQLGKIARGFGIPGMRKKGEIPQLGTPKSNEKRVYPFLSLPIGNPFFAMVIVDSPIDDTAYPQGLGAFGNALMPHRRHERPNIVVNQGKRKNGKYRSRSKRR